MLEWFQQGEIAEGTPGYGGRSTPTGAGEQLVSPVHADGATQSSGGAYGAYGVWEGSTASSSPS